ncbi:Nonribosomal peptide synthetase ACTTS4 [Bienertia sinuspersici]
MLINLWRRGLKTATGNDSSKLVDIKYERLGNFCYFCGRLGHVDRDFCCNGGEEDNTKDVLNSVNECEKEYKLLNKLKNGREERILNYDDPNILKLGPPSLARKSLSRELKEAKNNGTIEDVTNIPAITSV